MERYQNLHKSVLRPKIWFRPCLNLPLPWKAIYPVVKNSIASYCIKEPSDHPLTCWRCLGMMKDHYTKLQFHLQHSNSTFHRESPEIRKLPVAGSYWYLCKIWWQKWRARLLPVPSVYKTLHFGQNSPPGDHSKNLAPGMNKAFKIEKVI